MTLGNGSTGVTTSAACVPKWRSPGNGVGSVPRRPVFLSEAPAAFTMSTIRSNTIRLSSAGGNWFFRAAAMVTIVPNSGIVIIADANWQGPA